MAAQSSPISKVADNMNLTWDEVDGIMQRAVKRAMAKRKKTPCVHLGIDETSCQKRHEYVTVLLDKRSGSVIDILQDRKAETLENRLKTHTPDELGKLESVTMDMWDPYIKAVKDAAPSWEEKIAFDRFHVSKKFNEALDKVRCREHRHLLEKNGMSPLTHTRYHWFWNSGRTDNRCGARPSFMDLTKLNLTTARAWRIKEAANTLWDYEYMGAAEKAWNKLLAWISRSKIDEMIKVGRTVKAYFRGILNAVRHKATNGMVEAKNSRIQQIKNMACGFRNRMRFRTAILFHLGKLDMAFHTI